MEQVNLSEKQNPKSRRLPTWWGIDCAYASCYAARYSFIADRHAVKIQRGRQPRTCFTGYRWTYAILRAGTISARDACHAGAIPAKRPTKAETAAPIAASEKDGKNAMRIPSVPNAKLDA